MNLSEIGWDAYAPARAPDSSYGRVAQATRDHLLIWTDSGEIEASISGHLRHSKVDLPCVGDWVLLQEGGWLLLVHFEERFKN